MKTKLNKLHEELIEIVEIIEEDALQDVLTFAQLKIVCQNQDEIPVIGDDWKITPPNIKRAIYHALRDHPLMQQVKP